MKLVKNVCFSHFNIYLLIIGRVEVCKFIISCLQRSHPLSEIQKDLNEALFCVVSIGNEELCDLLIESGAQIV